MIRAAALGAVLLMALCACTAWDSAPGRHAVAWFDTPDAEPVTHDAIAQLMARPWPDAIDVDVEASDADRIPRTLASCRDYLEVADRRPRALAGGTTSVIFQARALDCQAMSLALDARPPVVSYLRPPVFDEGLPDRLPWQAAMITSRAEAERIAAERPDATWRQALFAPLSEFAPCGTHCARYGDSVQEQVLRLVAQGDFDGDGIDDMLLASTEITTGGSYHAVRMLVFTRRQAEGRVELVRELQ